MIPSFIVEPQPPTEDAQAPSRLYRSERAAPNPSDTLYVAQQNEPTRRPGDIEPLGIATIQCPGCYTVRCGFLGHSTCLVCC